MTYIQLTICLHNTAHFQDVALILCHTLSIHCRGMSPKVPLLSDHLYLDSFQQDLQRMQGSFRFRDLVDAIKSF